MCRRHEAEMFQSSCTSWSSKIIDDGTVDSNQRTFGSVHDSWYSQVYSSKSATCSRAPDLMSRRCAIRVRDGYERALCDVGRGDSRVYGGEVRHLLAAAVVIP